MSAFFALINGKKTYIVAGLIALCAGAQALGFAVPEWLWLLLNAAGFGAVRDAIGKTEFKPMAGSSYAGSARMLASPWVMPFAICISLGFVLSGCAQLEKAAAGIDAAATRFEAKGSAALLRVNTALVRASPAVALWAERCDTALGYVHSIGAAGFLSARTLANADRAGAACRALAANPTLTAAGVATQLARALTTLQQSAQVK